MATEITPLVFNLVGRLGKGNRTVPAEFQIGILGLDANELRRFEGKKAYDVGCGNGDLVRYMRARGVDAYGIDPRSPEDEYFIRRNVCGLGEETGIPASDRSVDLLTAFQNSSINSLDYTGFSTVCQIRETSQEFLNEGCLHAQMCVSEMMRTLSPTGRAVIFPDAERFEGIFSLSLGLEGVRFSREKVDPAIVREYLDWEHEMDGFASNVVMEKYAQRLVLTRGK